MQLKPTKIKIVGFTLICYFILLIFSQLHGGTYQLVSHESLSTNSPEIILENLLQYYDWQTSSLVRDSEFPRGMHQGILNNIAFYSIIYLGKFFGLDATVTQLFIGTILQIYGLNLIRDVFLNEKFNKNIYPFLVLIWLLNIQGISLILGGGFYWINAGFLLVSFGSGARALSSRDYKIPIIFILSTSIMFYCGIVWLHLWVILFIGLFIYEVKKNIQIFTLRNFIIYFIILILCTPYLYILLKEPIYPFYYGNTTKVLYAISSGFSRDINNFGRATDFFINFTITTFVILFLYKNKNNKILLFIYILIVLWQISPIGDFIARYVPLFQNFRSTYKLVLITNIILFILAIRRSWSIKERNLIYIFILIQFLYLSINLKNFRYTVIPSSYLEAQIYLNQYSGKKILYPHSIHEDTMQHTYEWDKNNKIPLYPVNVFSIYLPLLNILDHDEIDNPSWTRLEFMIASENNDQEYFYKLLLKNNVEYLVNDSQKKNSSIHLSLNMPRFQLIKNFNQISIFRVLNDGTKISTVNNDNDNNLKLNFFKSNISKIGILDYIEDYKIIRLFTQNYINPYHYFQFDFKLARNNDICFLAPDNLRNILFYDFNDLKGSVLYKDSKQFLRPLKFSPVSSSGILGKLYEVPEGQKREVCISVESRGKIYFQIK